MVRYLALFLAVALVLACGGGGGAASSGGGGGGNGSLTFEQKQVAITAISDKLFSLASLPQDQRRSQFVTWATSQPTTKAAGISTKGDNLFVTFTDGSDFPILDNMRPVTPVRSPSFAPSKQIPNLPQGLKAWTGHSLGGKPFAKRNADIQGWLQTHGYEVQNEEKVTVEKIISGWNDAAVVYWEAHMGSLPIKDGLEDMILLTDELQTKERDAVLKPYVDKFEVGVGGFCKYDANGKLEKVLPCYAVTPTFIRNHIKLKSNALVAMMGCTSGDRTVKDAFVVAKVGTFIGNSAPAFGRMPNQFAKIFDRLLGTNATDPKENPEERPYNMVAVENWMQNKGYVQDPDIEPGHPRAQIIWYYKSGEESYILRPTIYRILWEANGAGQNFVKWLLEGDFGPDQGPGKSRVLWNNQELTIQEWTPQYVKVRIPKAKPYPQGNIELITQDRHSNLVPMTEWAIPFVYTLTGKGTLKLVVTGTIRVRGDLRANRNMPEESLQTGAPVALVTMMDSNATLAASGSYKQGSTTYTWSGSKSLTSVDTGNPPPDFLSFAGYFDKKNFRLNQCFLLGGSTYMQVEKSGTSTTTITKGFGFDGIPLNFTMTILPGSYILGAKTIPGGALGEPFGVSSEVKFSATIPVFPPDNKTQARPIE